LNASATEEKTTGKAEKMENLPPLVPLPADEDPFLRAKKFVADGNLPKSRPCRRSKTDPC
jgi:hypothetical protein